MRNNLIVWPILLIAGFLAGFIPQHSKGNRLEEKVSASTVQIEACQFSEQLSQLRDAATLCTWRRHKRITELREMMPTVSLTRPSALRIAPKTKPCAICSVEFYQCAIRS
jgi:hypothetical protein